MIDLEEHYRQRFFAGEPIGELFTDTLHPSAMGSALIAERIVQAIDEEGLLPQPAAGKEKM